MRRRTAIVCGSILLVVVAIFVSVVVVESQRQRPPPPRAGFGFFTSRGPYIPVCNWVPGERTRQGIRYTALGIQHGAGGKVVGWLAEQGHPLVEGWETIADHPSRGLVVAVPPADDHERVLVWLLHAADLLCPVQLTGEWRASAFRR